MDRDAPLPRLLPIGQFSDLSGFSCRMLRFYAERELLVPAQTDPRTGYRHYLLSQLAEADLLQLLRDADFSLGEIAALLNGHGKSVPKDLVATRREMVLRKIQALQFSLDLLDRMEERDLADTYRLVQTLPVPLDTLPLRGDPAHLREQARAAAAPLLGEDDHDGVPILCTYPLATGPSEALVCVPTDRKTGRTLPGGLLGTALHRGDYALLPRTLELLASWSRRQGYALEGSVQEWYFPGGAEGAPYGRVEVALPLRLAGAG